MAGLVGFFSPKLAFWGSGSPSFMASNRWRQEEKKQIWTISCWFFCEMSLERSHQFKFLFKLVFWSIHHILNFIKLFVIAMHHRGAGEKLHIGKKIAPDFVLKNGSLKVDFFHDFESIFRRQFWQRREVNNRLTGWAFAHPVNLFAHLVNSTCPLPKIAHPVNDLSHQKMVTTIIKNRQETEVFANLTTPRGKPTRSSLVK